jgi:hypothetical protein
MAPLRTWKELFLGERALKPKRSERQRRRDPHHALSMTASHAVAGE